MTLQRNPHPKSPSPKKLNKEKIHRNITLAMDFL